MLRHFAMEYELAPLSHQDVVNRYRHERETREQTSLAVRAGHRYEICLNRASDAGVVYLANRNLEPGVSFAVDPDAWYTNVGVRFMRPTLYRPNGDAVRYESVLEEGLLWN